MSYENELYEPVTDIDKALLASIPQKVFGWLTFLCEVDRGYYGDLFWEFSDEKSSIFVDGMYPTQIWVKGPLDSPTKVYGLEAWMADISNHLEYFTAYEKRIYDILEELTDEVDARQRAIIETDEDD